LAVNSLPLSERMYSGTPSVINRVLSTSNTSSDFSENPRAYLPYIIYFMPIFPTSSTLFQTQVYNKYKNQSIYSSKKCQ
jgi:hypothetical protein